MKKIILMIVVVVIIAGVSAGGVYLWQKGIFDKEKTNLTNEISNLQQQISQKQNVSSQTSDWNTFNGEKNYINLKGRYSFKYPKGFTVVKSQEPTFQYNVLNVQGETVLRVDVRTMGCEGNTEECASFGEFLKSLITLHSKDSAWEVSVRPDDKIDAESKKIIDQIIATFVLEDK